MAKRITVIVSQGQSANPAKRKLEEDIVAGLLGTPAVDPMVVPHLYDLAPDSTGMLCLSGIAGDMIVCSWLFPRAACWTLDRNGIRGRRGVTLIKAFGESDEEDEDDEDRADEDDTASDDAEPKQRVADRRETARRTIYCLDLRTHDSAELYLEEIRRIAQEASVETVELTDWINGSPKPEQMERYLQNGDPADGSPANNGDQVSATPSGPIKLTSGKITLDGASIGDPSVATGEPARRWYPVIDFSRCTNCMECIDFCLFGVYGADAAETILVEQPDNCRKGCPACSRVCPENAIIFPQHKTPTIAGSPEVAGAMKIDLSLLFGAPEPGAPGEADAGDVAARERDEQLVLAGREAVGATVSADRRQADKPSTSQDAAPQDDLDHLMDQLDEFDL